MVLLLCASCARDKERVVANDPRGTAVLEYIHEKAGGEGAREEFQLRSRGQSQRVYGPARAGANTALHTVAFGPDSVYVLRCSDTEPPLFLGWRLSSLTPLPENAAVRGVYQTIPAILRSQTFAQLCAAPPKLDPPAATGQPASYPSRLLRDD
jgi:hypothetical protein